MARHRTGLRRPGRSAPLSAYMRGRRDGYPLGWEHGYWYGRCEAVLQASLPPASRRPLHLLYITSGKGYPYSPLDEGIVATLEGLVERLTVAHPEQPDLIDRARTDRPQLALALDGMNFPPEQALRLRELGVRTAIWFTDDPYYTDITFALAPHYDIVFTLEKNCVPYYVQMGCPAVHYLPLGVFPGAFRPRNPRLSQRGDLVFIGTAYWNRVRLFHEALPFIAHRRFKLSGLWWDRMPDYARWRDRIDLGRWLTPAETAEQYNAHKLVVNAHRAHDDETFNRNGAGIPAASPNPRTFEIAACGTLQLTDARDDLARFYTPGVEIATYDSPADLAAKAEYYLNHEAERRQMALRALQRTMREHTYASRLSALLDLAAQP